MKKQQEYDAFVEKFKPKKTTDDCYTPPAVYEVIRNWVFDRYHLAPSTPVVRPFFPGGDFENETYHPGEVVIDNPPFSIYARCVRFFLERDIPFFLFAPNLTLFPPKMETAQHAKLTYIVTDAAIIYENGARIRTAFVTNLSPGTCLLSAPGLGQAIKDVQKSDTPIRPRYLYPDELVTTTRLNRLAYLGIEYAVPFSEVVAFTTAIDAQKAQKKSIFGGGILVKSTEGRRISVVQREAEKGRIYVYSLSEREKALCGTQNENL